MFKRRFFVLILMISISNCVTYASRDTHLQCRDLHIFTYSYSRTHQLYSSCLLGDGSVGECKPISHCNHEQLGIVRLNICCLNGKEIYVCCPKVTEMLISETVYKAGLENFSMNVKNKTDYPVPVRQTENKSNRHKQTGFSDYTSNQRNFENYTIGQMDAGKHRSVLKYDPMQISGEKHRSKQTNTEKHKSILTDNEKHISDPIDFSKGEVQRMDFLKPVIEQIHIEEHILVQTDDGKQRQEQTAIVRHKAKQYIGANHTTEQTDRKNYDAIADDLKHQTSFGKPAFKQIGTEEHRLRQTDDGKYTKEHIILGSSVFTEVPFGKFVVHQADTSKHTTDTIFDKKDETLRTDNVNHRLQNGDVREHLMDQKDYEKNGFLKNSGEKFEPYIDNNGRYKPESSVGVPMVENLDFLLSDFERAESVVIKSSSNTEPQIKVLHDEYLNPPIVETFLTEDVAYRSAECGRRLGGTNKRSIFKGFVLRGSNAQERDWPWVVSVQVQNKWGLDRFLCGGSLITRRHVLSAAHCFDSVHRNSLQIFVFLGSNKRNPKPNESATKVDITKIKIHENYDKSRHYNDIAIMTLANEVQSEKIVPVCLPEGKGTTVNSYQQVTVLGWGQLKLGGATSENLQQATLQVIPESDCRRAYVNVSKESLQIGIVSSMICAGAPTGGEDACEGDSGGPLLMESKGRWVQVGIVSFGYKCGLENYPGVYTRVSSFVPWIKQTISADNQQ